MSGSPVALPLDIETNPPNGWAGFAVAPNGTLAYRTDAFSTVGLTWSDENGTEQAAVDSTGRFSDARLSPDGRRIAVVRDGDVWVYDTQRELFSRLTNTEQIEKSPTWSPDGRDLYYIRDVPQYDIFRRAADGSRAEELVVTSTNDKWVTTISPDGRTLLYQSDITGDDDIYATSPNPVDRARSTPVVTGPGGQTTAKFSADGMWFIYTSNESGRSEIFLSPFPADRGPARQQVSVGGGSVADWGPDGRTVYYNWSGRLYRVRVNPRTGEIGRPEQLSRIQPVLGWAIARDGRFLLARPSKTSERHSIKVVLNWAATLRDGGSH